MSSLKFISKFAFCVYYVNTLAVNKTYIHIRPYIHHGNLVLAILFHTKCMKHVNYFKKSIFLLDAAKSGRIMISVCHKRFSWCGQILWYQLKKCFFWNNWHHIIFSSSTNSQHSHSFKVLYDHLIIYLHIRFWYLQNHLDLTIMVELNKIFVFI